MIDRRTLLRDLRLLLRRLEKDLRERVDGTQHLRQGLDEEYRDARQQGRTGEEFEAWRGERITQVAVNWLLACAFLRFLEDNGLIDEPWIAGLGDRLRRAQDRQTVHFQEHPTDSDRDWLERAFRDLAGHPDLAPLFAEGVNPLWRLSISGDAAGELIQFFRRIEPDTGLLAHDFTDPDWDTRFLGDLYQDLSDEAKARYALLQTPDFIEEFILDRTLTPAIAEFGYEAVRLIDPTCGSGHFLLGAFRRLLALQETHKPGLAPAARVEAALKGVAGVDLNPFAVAIARFRLLVAALRGAQITRIADAPAFRFQLAVGDSLLHGAQFARPGRGGVQLGLPAVNPIQHHFYAVEDAAAITQVLGHQYHVVVGNPPYITVKDRVLNQAYRELYGSCHMKYSLVVPFLERFFELALGGDEKNGAGAGHVGLIVANSFMKREFGKKLIESYIPSWDLTHVIDTSGAYIPGHGTPTVIMFGRNRAPVAPVVRMVQGIRGEPSTPEDATQGLVWQDILGQIDRPRSTGRFVSVVDQARGELQHHPWSIGGGGAAELKGRIDERGVRVVADCDVQIGFMGITAADDVMIAPREAFLRFGIKLDETRTLVVGEDVRDWGVSGGQHVLFPYDSDGLVPVSSRPQTLRWLWHCRAILGNRATFGKSTYFEEGRPWWEWHQIVLDRIWQPLSIAFAFVSTHNHFVLDRGGKVFKQSAPVIKLPPTATEEDHLRLLALLNSSTAAFWFRQVCFPKGGDQVGNEGARVRGTMWETFLEFTAANIQPFPLVDGAPVDLARKLDDLARARADLLPGALASRTTPTRPALNDAHAEADRLLAEMIFWQEELDWHVYRLYGLLEEDFATPPGTTPSLRLGERAFEVVMARQMAAGELETTWFARHGSTPIAELPESWPAAYRSVVERRIARLESDRNIALIEQPECKRRWNLESWDAQEERALRTWLLDRLESPTLWPKETPRFQTCAALADRLRHDPEFLSVVELRAGRADFDLTALVTELVEGEGVPFLPSLRYRESGLEKRRQWERTWDLQRREDAIDARTRLPNGHPDRLSEDDAKELKKAELGRIPVPPKYVQADFQSGSSWKHRGKLDVPKERFFLYPFLTREADPTLVLGWAGWDELEHALALAAYYEERRTQDAWPAERLASLLACLQELVPWLLQWHDELEPKWGQRMGQYFQDFVSEELRRVGLTADDLRAVRPAAPKRSRAGKRER